MKFYKIINNPNSSEFMLKLASAVSSEVTSDNWQDSATIPPDMIFSDSNQVVSSPLINGDEIFSKHAELILGASGRFFCKHLLMKHNPTLEKNS